VTLELAPPPPALERKPVRQEYDPREVCHLSVDFELTLCGRRCGGHIVAMHLDGSSYLTDPCGCGLKRCPRCKSIWSE